MTIFIVRSGASHGLVRAATPEDAGRAMAELEAARWGDDPEDYVAGWLPLEIVPVAGWLPLEIVPDGTAGVLATWFEMPQPQPQSTKIPFPEKE